MPETTLRIDARPGWHQRMMYGHRTRAVEHRMEGLGAAALEQFDFLTSVTVTAQSATGTRSLTFHRQASWTRGE